jgi:hypothetical protein
MFWDVTPFSLVDNQLFGRTYCPHHQCKRRSIFYPDVIICSWFISKLTGSKLLYILESNPHPFYSCRGLKGQMRIRIACGLDSRSRAGVWPNDRAGVRAVRTIQGGKNGVRIRFENIRYIMRR